MKLSSKDNKKYTTLIIGAACILTCSILLALVRSYNTNLLLKLKPQDISSIAVFDTAFDPPTEVMTLVQAEDTEAIEHFVEAITNASSGSEDCGKGSCGGLNQLYFIITLSNDKRMELLVYQNRRCNDHTIEIAIVSRAESSTLYLGNMQSNTGLYSWLEANGLLEKLGCI
jgi:hypothetical protein